MKAFYVADGMIQGILILSLIAGILGNIFHFPFSFPLPFIFYALCGWHLLSSLIQVTGRQKIRYTRPLYLLHRVLLGYSVVLAMVTFVGSDWGIAALGRWEDLYVKVVYIGFLMVLPLMMLIISIFTISRLFTAPSSSR